MNAEFTNEEEQYTDEELFSSLKGDGIRFSDEDIQLARDGDGEKLYRIGYQYHHLGDYIRALTWFLKAAETNHSTALYDVGCAYHYGFGVEPDYKEAMKWYLKAVDSDQNQYAQNNIGMLYYSGCGVPENNQTALEWFTKSAKQGYSLGQAYVRDLNDNGYYLEDQENELTECKQKTKDSKTDKLDSTIQSLQKQIELMDEKIKNIEESFQLKFEKLQEEQREMKFQHLKKDQEIKQLKEALAQYKKD